MSEDEDNPTDADAFDMSQYPQVQVVSITKEAASEGYVGHVRIRVEYPDGESTEITASVMLRDYPWGSEWHADFQYAGKTLSFPHAMPVHLNHRALYGAIHDGKRLDTLEAETRLRDGQRRIQRDEAKPRPNAARRERSAEEYEQWAIDYFSDSGADDTSEEEDTDTRVDEMDELFEEPLRFIPLMMGLWFTIGPIFEPPDS